MVSQGIAAASRARATTGRKVRRRLSIHTDAAILTAAAVVVGVAAIAVVTGMSSAASDDPISGFAPVLVNLMAALLVAKAARTAQTTRIRVAWSLIATGMFVYALGDGIWAWIAVVNNGEPFPSAADAAYISFYPIIAGALLLFPTPGRARREAIRLAVDSAIVVLGGGMLIWHSLFRPALDIAGASTTDSALVLAYPIGDLVLLFAVATIALRRTIGIEPRALLAMVGGLALMFAADAAYGEISLAGGPDQSWVDFLYLASGLTIGFAGFLQTRPISAPATREERPGRWSLALPYAGLAAGFGVLLAASSGEVDGSVSDLLKGAIGLTILVLIRLELANRENGRLIADDVRRESDARYRSLAGQTSDAVLLVDASGFIAYASPSVGRVLGIDIETVLGKAVKTLSHADDSAALERLVAETAAGRPVSPLEWRLWGRDGTWRNVETVSTNLLNDPNVGKVLLTTRDVKERMVLRQQLTQAALHDLLTGLPNHALFIDRIGQALASGQRTRRSTTILSLDLDHFRRVNDSLGHAIGDHVLREVGRRLASTIRSADTVARLGGDEFGILLDSATVDAEPMDLAERLRVALKQPMTYGGATFEMTASIGVATCEPVDTVDPTTLARNANVAMTVAEDCGRDRIVVFQPSMQVALAAQFELEADLRLAVGNQEFVLQYQPIIDLSTGELVAAEALIRWNHPTRGRLGPDVFIPLAEDSGLIVDLGTWALRTACTEVARWARRAPNRVPRVSVNLASAQLVDPQLPWVVQSALSEAGAAPGWLTLELTESQLIQDSAEVLERLHAIRALGVQISIDDFGTGYSSLAYLQRYPVSHIKIDRSFVTPLDEPDRGPGVAAAIIEIGRALGMSTIAEGIETERQLERLRTMGCPLGQGYLLSRPLDPEAIRELVDATNSKSTEVAPAA